MRRSAPLFIVLVTVACAGAVSAAPYAVTFLDGRTVQVVDLGSLKSDGSLVTYDFVMLVRDPPKLTGAKFEYLVETHETRCADGLTRRTSMTTVYRAGIGPGVPIENDTWVAPYGPELRIVCTGEASPAGTFPDLAAARRAMLRLPRAPSPPPP